MRLLYALSQQSVFPFSYFCKCKYLANPRHDSQSPNTICRPSRPDTAWITHHHHPSTHNLYVCRKTSTAQERHIHIDTQRATSLCDIILQSDRNKFIPSNCISPEGIRRLCGDVASKVVVCSALRLTFCVHIVGT